MTKFDKLVRELGEMAAGANTSCREFTAKLEEFGFKIRGGSSGGHKIVTHPAVELQEGANYNCGHSPGTMVKRPYVKKFLRIVQENEEALRSYLK